MAKKFSDLQNKIKNKLQSAISGKGEDNSVDEQQRKKARNEQIKKYAEFSNSKIIVSKSDLPSDAYPIPEMITWCKEQADIIALNDGTILSSNPVSRNVQNCKSIMLQFGIAPKQVLASTPQLLQLIFTATPTPGTHAGVAAEIVSAQQQRLRILVLEALQNNISDIHLEVRPDIAKIRFRRHGELYLHAEWLPKLATEIVSVSFNKETDYAVTHFNPLIPQNASMPLVIEGKNIRLRLASMPAYNGFDVVMRVLTTGEERIPTLEGLGYTSLQTKLIKKAIVMPHGAIIISGPTGSGKTTTLASCINMLDAARKIYTIEDPVEKIVDKATQIPVSEDQEQRTFASMGRAALRMDPDVIVLGEMRDLDTASVMTRASMTGHLVFSTLHTNTAPGIIQRLIDLGVSSTLLGAPSMLICLIFQRLMPTLCTDCSIPLLESSAHEHEISRLQRIFGDDLSNFRARGNRYCETCKGLGIAARTVVAEVVWLDEPSLLFIQKNDMLGWQKYLVDNGWEPYTVHSFNLVKQGVCDPLDAEKIIGIMDPEFTAKSFNYREI